jgi:hypothetical protein
MREQSHDPVIPRASLSAIPGAAQSLQPFPQSPILRLQLSNQLDELSPLVPQLGELFNFFRSHKRFGAREEYPYFARQEYPITTPTGGAFAPQINRFLAAGQIARSGTGCPRFHQGMDLFVETEHVT